MRHIWIVAAVLAALLLGVLFALSRIGTMAPTATGWAARTICSGHLAAGRDLDAVLRELPPELRPGWLHARIGPDEDRVTVEMLGGWFPPLAQQEGGLVERVGERPKLFIAPVEHGSDRFSDLRSCLSRQKRQKWIACNVSSQANVRRKHHVTLGPGGEKPSTIAIELVCDYHLLALPANR